jgi:Response regulators consisting of a CheY-like receiver domain and a winged-helix DNA-binding domain
MKILIVEDDLLLRTGLYEALRREGYTVDASSNAKEAKQKMSMELYSAVLLDLGLPDEDGISVLKKWRAEKVTIPVLIMTARDALEDRINGLDAGADDYLIKPFELIELLARLRAVIRRHVGESDNLMTVGDLSLDLANREIFYKNKLLSLTPREYAILSRLIFKKGKTVAREILQQDIYSWEDSMGSNTLEVYIHHLRQKMSKGSIVTVRGVGYQLGENE